ncbi:MAG: DedA family protein [Zetaproteobacteria bacterium]|nr:MAG: DedA family protein [Zetaproteobacteria bacterium]
MIFRFACDYLSSLTLHASLLTMEWAQHFVEQYGYWAVFIWTFIEGESVFIAAAALSAAGIMDTWTVILVAALGAFAGHMFFFALGRWKGMSIIESIPFLERHHPKANVILDKYAHWSIFIFQYLYGTRIVAALLFGCSSIEFWRFFLLQIVNCLSWAFIIYAVGHALGIAGMAILHRFGVIGLITVILIAGVVGLIIYFRFGHHHVKNHLNNVHNRHNK